MKIEKGELLIIEVSQLNSWAKGLFLLHKKVEETSDITCSESYNCIYDVSQLLYSYQRQAKGRNHCKIEISYFRFLIKELQEKVINVLKNSTSPIDSPSYKKVTEIVSDMRRIDNEYNVKKTTIKEAKDTTQDNVVYQFLTDNALASSITTLISETKEELLLSSPWIDGDTDFMNTLLKLKDVKTKTIITRKAKEESQHAIAINKLIAEHIPFEINELLHTKLIIVDRKQMYIGSANMVERSFSTLEEVGIITNDSHLIKAAVKYFDNLRRKTAQSRAIKPSEKKQLSEKKKK